MPRQPRLDYPGAVHHVFVRGNARSPVALDDEDHQRALKMLERAASRFELVCHAWCYLPNHSHLLVTSKLGNLSSAMHWLGTCGAHSFNRRHERSGHLFQGRFGSKLVKTMAISSSWRDLCRSTRCGRDCVARRRIGSGRATGRPRVCGQLRRFSTRGSFHPPLLGSRGMRTSPGSRRASTRASSMSTAFGSPPPRTPLAILLADGSDHAISCAHSDGYSHSAIAEHLGMTRRGRSVAGSLHNWGSDPRARCTTGGLTPECARELLAGVPHAAACADC